MTRHASTGAGTAVIAGAGIGGLAAALTLREAGVETILVEQRTALGETGAGIQLSPNASNVLFALGLGPALMRHAVEPQRVRVRALAGGAELARMELGQAMRDRYGAPYLVIARNDLHMVMLDALRGGPGARILTGRTVTAAHTRGERAVVTAARGNGQEEELAGDFAIGADGVWSRLRRALGAAPPRYRGYHAWRAVIPAGALPAGLDVAETGLWLGSGRHLVHYGVNAGRSVNVVAVIPAREALPAWSHEADPQTVRDAFRDAHPQARTLVASAGEWRIHALHDAPPPARWSSGRVTLLGDAAHPVLPFLAQGGALAIEDAATLASLVGEAMRAGMPLPRALEMYAAARRARAARVQREGRRNGWIYHLPPPLSLARNLVMRRMGGDGVLARHDWLYGWRPPQIAAARRTG
ncbi:FAD-dependent monooxygenase [Camelimonas abortus]|uniref:FAD-dependent monooxygenase n=1 Tax=Camelimonas abortus TaxID=1017184 RepID=A0ABV7LE42_9HYPH